MKHAIAPEHRSFYQFHGWIEFSDLILPEICTALIDELNALLLKRMQMSERYLSHITKAEKFLHGRDLFRDSSLCKKITASPDFASIAAQLNDVKEVRLGADQLIPGGYLMKPSIGKLKEYFPFNDVLGGLVISLQGGIEQEIHAKESQEEEAPIPFSPLPTKAANAIFFKKDKLLNMDFSLLPSADLYILVVYTPQKIFYVHNENDLNAHTMRQLGYQYGDFLTNQKHPLLVR